MSAVALPQLPNKCEGSSPDFLRCALALDPSTRLSRGCEARLAQRAGETRSWGPGGYRNQLSYLGEGPESQGDRF